jgi:hypothetical protein
LVDPLEPLPLGSCTDATDRADEFQLAAASAATPLSDAAGQSVHSGIQMQTSSAASAVPAGRKSVASLAEIVSSFRQEIGMKGDDNYNKLVLPHVIKHCPQLQSYVLGKVGTMS